MKLRILITGGTIDKGYDPMKEINLGKSHIPEMLQEARARVSLKKEVLMMKYSPDITKKDIQKILARCKSAKEKNILITHGTDTMVRTAKTLGKAKLNKTIVLTGAMVPHIVLGSDALFNLGCAITAVQILLPGVYIAMNGKIFNWNNVRKNRKIGEFVCKK